MKSFDKDRNLVEHDPCEFFDDIEYMPSMDSAIHYVMNPEKSDFPEAAKRQRDGYWLKRYE